MASEQQEGTDVLAVEAAALTLPSALPAEEARELLHQLDAAAHSPEGLSLTRRDGRPVKVPSALAALLRQVLEPLSRGDGVAVVAVERELTPKQAADLLNVSRQHFTRLLDAGELAFRRVGSHRRVRLEDVLGYKRRRDAERRAALDEMLRASEDADLYEKLD